MAQATSAASPELVHWSPGTTAGMIRSGKAIGGRRRCGSTDLQCSPAMTWRDPDRRSSRHCWRTPASVGRRSSPWRGCSDAGTPHRAPAAAQRRGAYVPQAQAEVESRLWFSPLVAARSTREIVLHLGVAKALALERMRGGAGRAWRALWQFTRRHTRHWSAEDRLERDLRYYALLDDEDRLKLGLRDILRRIHEEQDEQPADRPLAPGQAYPARRRPAGQRARGGPGAGAICRPGPGRRRELDPARAQPGQPQALPGWLAAKLPAPVASAELGVEIRHDPERGQVLHLVAAETPTASVSPSRARCRPGCTSPARAGPAPGTRSPSTPASGSTPPSRRLRLITLDGRQWDLRTDELPDPGAGEAGAAAGRRRRHCC